MKTNSKIHSKLIGLSGKMNGGKDFSAKLIQAMICEEVEGKEVDIFDFINNVGKYYRNKMSGFKTIAFADKLKTMCALATGTDEELWHDRKLKEEPLPAPFDMYSPRTFMTTFGQQCREMDKDFFVKAAFADYKPMLGSLGMFDVDTEKFFPNWIVTDVRFPNEADALIAKGGILIRVDRPLANRHGFDALEDVKKDDPKLAAKLLNESEISLDGYAFPERVEWTDDPYTLISDLESILVSHGILTR